MSKVLANRYELFERVGEGGMSVVYKAKDRLLNRFVAIKILKPEFIGDQKFIESFRRESQNAASMSHPNIVNIYDVGREGNIHYIVMEYVDGITVAEYVERNGRVPFSKCMEYMDPVMKALETIHGKKMVHRDISPSNIMIRKNGGVKLLDFGAARIVDSVSRSLSVIIRPGYTPIEQYSEKRSQGPYTDIFALCGTFYYMLTGSAPENLYDRMTKRAELKHPSELGADISLEQELAVLKGLEINPEDRFQTIGELREVLSGSKSISYITIPSE